MKEKIVRGARRKHLKASEEYIDVTFNYPEYALDVSIPITYRRTGLDLKTDEEIESHIETVYILCESAKVQEWLKGEQAFWKTKPNAAVTKSFFDRLAKKISWCCVKCDFPANPNWARRTQDLKEFGYTLATYTSKYCRRCDKKTTQMLLLPVPRGSGGGYEIWTPTLRKRIIEQHKSFDAYEGKRGSHLLPDHKFPEIRWDFETRRETLEHLTAAEIQNDFQLLSNQRNQQKREVCRTCFQTGKRGYPFGIKFYYKGNEDWPSDIPAAGKKAEDGCVGCGWYDLNAWRDALMNSLGSSKK